MDVGSEPSRYEALSADDPLWESFRTVAPLVLIGTVEADGSPDVAPKHQATPIGHGSLFGFVCSPEHATYRNVAARGTFTVGFPPPGLVVAASLAAAPRDARGNKPTLDLVSLSPARVVEGVLVDGCLAQLECRLERVVGDLDDSVLVVGRVAAAFVSTRVRDDSTPLLAYVHPGRVASIHETKEFPYHRGFHR